MADLAYDTNTLRTQAAKIDKIASNLEKAKTDLSSWLTTLRSEWDSDAGAAFFATYDTTWVKHVQDYLDMLHELSKALNDAANHYEPLTAEYNRISLDV